MSYTVLMEQELQALLRIPAFRKPNAISPLHAYQREGSQGGNTMEGFQSLMDRGFWSAQHQELSPRGQSLLVPLFLNDVRIIMQLRHKDPKVYCGYKNAFVQCIDKGNKNSQVCSVSRPIKDKQLLEGVRQHLQQNRRQGKESQLKLYLHEYMALFAARQLEERKEPVSVSGIVTQLKQLTAPNAYPILGGLQEDDEHWQQSKKLPQTLPETLELLLQDKLIKQKPDGSYMLDPHTAMVFHSLLKDDELILQREERTGQSVTTRRASIFSGFVGYQLATLHTQTPGAAMLHIESIEWIELRNLLNEIFMPQEYIPALKLQTNIGMLQQVFI